VSLAGIVPFGYMGMAMVLFAWLRSGDKRTVRGRLSATYLILLGVVALGYFNAVNTYWLFLNFVEIATYWLIFCIALPLVLEERKYFIGLVKLMFVSYAVIGVWVITHNGHGQGAFLGDENDAALALGVGLGLCYPLRPVLAERSWRWFGLVVMALCAAGIVASASRGGFVGLVAVLLATAYLSGRLLRVLTVIAVVGLLALPLVPDQYFKEIQSINDPTESTRVQRLYMWRIGFQAYMSNPVLGIGAGNYGYRVADYETTPFVQKKNIFGRSFGGRAVHSTYFQILPELGTGGAIIFLVLATSVLRTGFAARKSGEGDDPTIVALARGTAAGMVAFLAAGAFVSAAYYPHFWMLCGLSASLTFMRGRNPDLPTNEKP
jgi:O-antigen ligase